MMKNGGLVSVIVAVYNVEHNLPRCLETVVAQTYRNLEIILVDDGSTDSSGRICDELAAQDPRVKVIHKANGKLFSARNAGQMAATGEYVMHVDGDDYLHVEAIETMVEAINKDGEHYDLALFERTFTHSLDEDIHAPLPVSASQSSLFTVLTQADLIKNLFTHSDDTLFAYSWNKLYRRELIDGILTRNFVRSQDFDYNLRIFLRAEKAIWVHRALYFYVQWDGAATHSAQSWSILYDCITRVLYQNLQELPDEQKQYRHFILTKLYRRMVSLKNDTLGTPRQEEAWKRCDDYEKATRKEFLGDKHIKLYTKVVLLFFLHSPRFVKWVKGLSKKKIGLGFLGKVFYWIR